VLQENYYITASCRISNHAIFKSGRLVFEAKDSGLPDFLLAAYHHFGFKYPKFYKMDDLCKLGWLASEALLKDSFHQGNYKQEEVGVVLANSNASLDTDLKYFESTKEFASPSLFVYTLPNIVMGEICIRNKFKGENAFFVQEQFDADFIKQYVNYLFNSDILQACICGWVDVLHENYESFLFLVEKSNNRNSVLFTAENIYSLNQKNQK
jgi:hypothetical protein